MTNKGEKLRELKIRLLQEPSNVQLKLSVIIEMSRIEGQTAFRKLLQDRLVWNAANVDQQDWAIETVGLSLGPAFQVKETKTYSCGGEKHRVATFLHSSSGIEMNLIPGGEYMMGTADIEAEILFCQSRGLKWKPDMYHYELPRHRVRVKSILVSKIPISNAQWYKAQESEVPEGLCIDDPKEGVSWEDCQNFLASSNLKMRLPSEAEWEYFCRSGTHSRFYWGDSFDGSYVVYRENCETQSRDSRDRFDKSNAFGLVDLCGNVLEWCEDDWCDTDYTSGPFDYRAQKRPEVPECSIRGGYWFSTAGFCRSAHRFQLPKNFILNCGLRVVKDLKALD